MRGVRRKRGFTLFELMLVSALLAVLAALAVPNLLRVLQDARLPESCRRMRGLIQLTRSYAMLEGLRYRIRFPGEGEIDGQGGARQPFVEVERNPLDEPEIFKPVLASWARDKVLEDDVRCLRVRLGRPTIEMLLGETEAEEAEEDIQEDIENKAAETFDEGFPPLIFEPDGTTEWATFVISDAPEGIELEDITPGDYQVVDVILDGLTGLVWLQRQLHVEELEMMRQNGWPPVMRKDFLDPRLLTEDDVLEIREELIRR